MINEQPAAHRGELAAQGRPVTHLPRGVSQSQGFRAASGGFGLGGAA